MQCPCIRCNPTDPVQQLRCHTDTEINRLRRHLVALDRLILTMQERINRLERVNDEALRAMDTAEEANRLLRELAHRHGAQHSAENTRAIQEIEAKLEAMQQP